MEVSSSAIVYNLLIRIAPVKFEFFFGFSVGSEMPVSSVKEKKVREFREIERQDMHRILDEYLNICSKMGV